MKTGTESIALSLVIAIVESESANKPKIKGMQR